MPDTPRGGNAQSLDTLLGKILRIDPTPSGGDAYTIPPDNRFADGGGAPEDGVVVDRGTLAPVRHLASFGEDANGELYVLSLSDGVSRIDPPA